MTNGNFSLDDILAALDALGLDFVLHGRRDVGPLRFCSMFAQEAGGLYFWEGDAAPDFEHAGIAVLTARPLDGDVACQIQLSHPQRAYYLLMRHFFAAPVAAETTIHPTAVIAASAQIGAGAHVGPYCFVDEGAMIGINAVLHSFVAIYRGARIGDDFFAHAHAVVRENCRIEIGRAHV